MKLSEQEKEKRIQNIRKFKNMISEYLQEIKEKIEKAFN